MSYEDVAEEDRTTMPRHKAAASAAISNKNNRELFTPEEQARADDIFHRANDAFPDLRVFENYRKTMACIKVEGVRVQDRVLRSVGEFEKWCEEENVEIHSSSGGSSRHYRFKRVK